MRRVRGQSTVEYAVCVAVAVGALLAMNVYVKRGHMGRLRRAADSLGSQFNPYVTEAKVVEHRELTQENRTSFGGITENTLISDDVQSRTAGYEKMIAAENKAHLAKETLFYNVCNDPLADDAAKTAAGC